jgi:hypothetical protein
MKPGLVRPLFVLAMLWIFASPAFPQTASVSEIKKEITRLQTDLKELRIPTKDFESLVSMAGDALKGAQAALDAGQLYLSVAKIGEADSLLRGVRSVDEAAEAEKNSLPGFEKKWNEVSLRLTALDKEAHLQNWNRAPLAVRALAEAAQGQSIPLLEGGRGFASATSPMEGLFYVGLAEGDVDFAKFCASLNLPAEPAAFPLRSLSAELHSLQEKTNAAFQPPKSIDLHPRFIDLNSAIKLANELDASKFFAGALISYLEGVRHFGMLDAPLPNTAEQGKLKLDVAAARQKLAASQSDGSIAQYFVERAESYTTHADGAVPTEDEWRGARVILDQVLPAYYAAQKPAAPFEVAPGKTVDITLVRWPYT